MAVRSRSTLGGPRVSPGKIETLVSQGLAPAMGVLLAGLTALPAFAESTAGAPQPPAPAAQPDATAPMAVVPESPQPKPQAATQIAEVVVTATKRKQNLRDIPASIAVVSGEELEQRGAQGAQDIVKLVPGVNLTQTGDEPPRVTIRGISSDIGTSSTTGAIFGDVSFTDAYVPYVFLDPNPFDLKNVEVLKGPQGTLFGASNLNGAIRYIPNGPRYGRWESRYFVNYTGIAEGGWAPSGGAVVNMPLFGRDDLALRLVGFERNTPGYIDNIGVGVKDANHLNQAGARAILGWQPSDSWDIDLTYAWQNTHTADTSSADNRNGDLSNDNRLRLSPNRQNYSMADGTVKYFFDWGQLISDTAWVRKSAYNFYEASARVLNHSPIPIDAQVYNAGSHTESEELRLVSPDNSNSPWHWVFGGLLLRQHILNTLTVPLLDPSVPTAVLAPILDQINPAFGTIFTSTGSLDVQGVQPNASVTEKAVFGEITRNLFKVVDLTLGGRYYRTASGGTNTLSGIAVLAEYQTSEKVLSGTIKEQGFNPKASLSVHLDDNVMSYATISKGYRVGGIQVGGALVPQPQDPVPVEFKSDTIWNYETGLRTQWLNKTLRIDFAAFHERWKNPQTVQADSTSTSVYIDNVGGVKSLGGETSIQYLFPIKGLMLSAAGGYTRTVTTTPFTNSSGKTIEPGTSWPLAPKWQTVATLAYALNLSPMVVTGSVTHTYLSKAISDLAEQNPVYNYRQLDAQLSILDADIPWLPELTVSASNLLDKRGVVNEFISPVSGSDDVTYIQPRTINIRASGRF